MADGENGGNEDGAIPPGVFYSARRSLRPRRPRLEDPDIMFAALGNGDISDADDEEDDASAIVDVADDDWANPQELSDSPGSSCTKQVHSPSGCKPLSSSRMGCFMRSQLHQTGACTITDCKPFSLSHMECSMRSQQQKLQAALFKPRGVLSEFPSTPSGLTHRQTASRCLQAAQSVQ
ncbi:hypothetical protein ISCGN_003885 [Ixodes scapularis]